jgi:hypothetical protein
MAGDSDICLQMVMDSISFSIDWRICRRENEGGGRSVELEERQDTTVARLAPAGMVEAHWCDNEEAKINRWF